MTDSLVPRDPGDAMVAIVTGTAALRVVEIAGPPYEDIPRAEAKLRGARIIDEVRRFVAGSALAGLVEIDLLSRRARVTLALSPATLAGVTMAVTILSTRLALTTAPEILGVLRMRWLESD